MAPWTPPSQGETFEERYSCLLKETIRCPGPVGHGSRAVRGRRVKPPITLITSSRVPWQLKSNCETIDAPFPNSPRSRSTGPRVQMGGTWDRTWLMWASQISAIASRSAGIYRERWRVPKKSAVMPEVALTKAPALTCADWSSVYTVPLQP